MSTWTVVRLVAGRELRMRLTSKAYVIATAGLIAAMVLGGFLFKVVGNDDPARVGLVPATSGLAEPITAISGPDDVQIVDVATDEAGRAQVANGSLAALLTGTPSDLQVVVSSGLDPALGSVFTAVAQQEALAAQISGLGGDPDTVPQSLLEAVPQVTELNPRTQDGARIAAAYVVGILIFMGLITAGQLVAQGVVEEKTSRIVELLLATIKPWQLMAGKVLGLGAVGVLQVGVLVVTGAGTATAFGLLDASDLNLGATAVAAIGWFVIGFATFALLLAGLAALVSRQEEVSAVISPVTVLMVVPYVIGISVGTWDPDNTLVTWLARMPFTAPFVMPIRIAAGEVAGWEIALAVGLSLAVIPVLTWLAGRLYANAVLQTGGRVRLLSALRGSAAPRMPKSAN